ncbi:MAG: alpha/beta fold hydrolase [Acidimicrobiales bacterium]
MSDGRLVEVADTRLFVEERGDGGVPILAFHGGPGLDHHMFGDYLDPLTDDRRYRLVLVDERAQGRSDRAAAPSTWTMARMVADITDVAASLGLDRYVVLGHSFGSFLALRHAVDFPGAAAATIVSGGVASARWLARVESELATFEPVELREQVASSWAREATVDSEADAAALFADQIPFHFGDPRDPRIADYSRRTPAARYSPDVLRAFANNGYGGIEVEDRLASVAQPVLVLSGRRDRTCSVEAGAEMAGLLPNAEFVVFEHSGHLFFVEEQDRFIEAVRGFLGRHID